MQVSIRELKNHLSMYLHKVQNGESIIVTSHRVPLAKLLPIPQSNDKTIQNLQSQEGISWNGKKPKGGKKPPKITGKTVADYVLKDRS